MTPATKALLEKIKARKLQAQESQVQELHIPAPSAPESELDSYSHILDKYGRSITLNSKQLQAVQLALEGKSFVLIGAAGTGKSTTQAAVTQALIRSGKISPLSSDSHKVLRKGAPGVAITSFTRRAVANIARMVSEDLKSNCLTHHALLEYAPKYFEVTDPTTGKVKTTMRFIPTRDASNPLDSTLGAFIFEESSMTGTDLYSKITDAINHPAQFIFLGDIQQLPPVFGPAILGFKMLELPVIELDEVYRQALESPIIKLAHRILSGKPIPYAEFPEWKFPGQLNIRAWQKPISPLEAGLTLTTVFKKSFDSGEYNPETDIILMAYKKTECGAWELNKGIATHLAKARGAKVFEVISGFQAKYFSIGDRVLVGREDAIITDIYPNPKYAGKVPQPESETLDYWGHDSVEHSAEEQLDDMDAFLSKIQAGNDGAEDEQTKQASHIIVCTHEATGKELRLSGAGDINSMELAYVLTVHKSQGSEWRKVFLCIHNSHNKMISRELLYTAVTRAREELVVICEKDTFVKGIGSQRIKGNTWQEKAEQFKGKKQSMQEEMEI